MKISILGASGKVGLETVRMLTEYFNLENQVDIVLFAPNNVAKIKGYIEELRELSIVRDNRISLKLKLYPSSQIEDISNSDLVIIAAGLWASEDEKKAFYDKDSSGRNIQSYKNYALIEYLCGNIKKYSSKADVIVVTNQSDVMAQWARLNLPQQKVYGLGCCLDTIRFKLLLSDILSENKIAVRTSDIEAMILGLHGKDMFLHEDSFGLGFTLPAERLEAFVAEALKRTKNRGKYISNLQKDIHCPQLNSGSSKLPAASLVNIIISYTQNDSRLLIPLNRRILKEEAQNYGLHNEVCAQLPCVISEGNIYNYPISMSENDCKNLQQCVDKFNYDFGNFYWFVKSKRLLLSFVKGKKRSDV